MQSLFSVSCELSIQYELSIEYDDAPIDYELPVEYEFFIEYELSFQSEPSVESALASGVRRAARQGVPALFSTNRLPPAYQAKLHARED
jgi:hypothetical protein